jgi:hypothetical protein
MEENPMETVGIRELKNKLTYYNGGISERRYFMVTRIGKDERKTEI